MAKKHSSGFRHFLDRLEPWIVFLSILAILFVPFGKGYWWTVLFGVAFIKLLRNWREAWTYFSLDTIGRTIQTLLCLPLLALIYSFLHAVAPGYVHTTANLDHLSGDYKFVVMTSSASRPWKADLLVKIEKAGKDFRLTATLKEKGPENALLNLEAVLEHDDLQRGAASDFSKGVPLRRIGGSLLAPFVGLEFTGSIRGQLKLDQSGKPNALVLTTGQDPVFIANGRS